MLIAPIVEGHGEVEAVPILIRRICNDLGQYDVRITKPVRCPRGKMFKPEEFARSFLFATYKLTSPGCILVICDADEDCPVNLGNILRLEATRIAPTLKTYVILPKFEFETWFLAALSSLRGKHNISSSANPPADPEAIRGAKEYLSQFMKDPYSETVDQPALTSLFDFTEARLKSRSFRKFSADMSAIFS